MMFKRGKEMMFKRRKNNFFLFIFHDVKARVKFLFFLSFSFFSLHGVQKRGRYFFLIIFFIMLSRRVKPFFFLSFLFFVHGIQMKGIFLFFSFFFYIIDVVASLTRLQVLFITLRRFFLHAIPGTERRY